MAITPDLLNFMPPDFSEAQIAAAVFKNYHLKGHLKALAGERDQNFRLTTDTGAHYIIKISGLNEDRQVVDFQTKGLLYMETTAPHLPIPRLIKCINGAPYNEINNTNNNAHQLRVLSYISGVSVGNDTPYSLETLREIGRFQAQVCKALAGFKHPASKHFMAWNSVNGLVFNKNLQAKFTPQEQGKLTDLIAPFENIFPEIKKLRHQVIHNDGHGWNILFKSGTNHTITGIIDFGDMIYAPLINDLAVTAESFTRPSDDLVTAIGAVTAGFNEIIPLTIAEIELLHDLVTLRGILTILLQGYKIHITSSPNQKLLIQDLMDEQPTHWDFVKRMNEVDHTRAISHYKSICKP